eukprot:4811131-Amphidinium_carterae.1
MWENLCNNEDASAIEDPETASAAVPQRLRRVPAISGEMPAAIDQWETVPPKYDHPGRSLNSKSSKFMGQAHEQA